jgi:hypothetical protein
LTAGNIIQKSTFSTGIVYTKSWGDGQLSSSSSAGSKRYVYFTAAVFVLHAYVVDVFWGYSSQNYNLQYWSGSAWVSVANYSVEDKDTANFEINTTTSESASNGRFQLVTGYTWWRMVIYNTNNYYPQKSTLRLDIYGLGAHLGYDTYVKGKQLKGLYLASTGVPYVHNSGTGYDKVPTDSYVSSLYNETSLRGTKISASLPEYCILPANL